MGFSFNAYLFVWFFKTIHPDIHMYFYRMRTESGQRHVNEEIWAAQDAGKERDAKELIRKYSTHPVDNAFYDLGKGVRNYFF